jgi:hypothetical protein
MALPIPLILAIIKMIPKLRKSKTAGANVLTGAIMTILNHFGINVEPEVISAVFVVVNLVMRMWTNKSLSEK